MAALTDIFIKRPVLSIVVSLLILLIGFRAATSLPIRQYPKLSNTVVNVTTVYPGVVKAWHYHRVQTDNFVVVSGMAKVVLYDDREASATRGQVNEFFLGDRNPILVQVPPLVCHGYKGIGADEVMLVNFPTEVYRPEQPDEYRLDPHRSGIPYDWSRRDG